MWERILNEARDEYARFLADQDRTVGAFLQIGAPSQWDDPTTTPHTGSNHGSPVGGANGADGNGVDSDDGAAGSALKLPIAVKDNIAVKSYHLSCGSRMLEGLTSPYDAASIARLRRAGASIVGKTNMDEFGMGSSTENSAFQATNNPWDRDRVAGGSSGGSAAAVAQQLVPAALGSDTGGSIRQPAAFCGVYGLKPTYGTVSRYGLVAYASSLEVIGVVAADVDTMAAVYRVIRGEDGMDHSSVAIPSHADSQDDADVVKTIGVLEGDLGVDETVARNYRRTAEALREAGYKVVPISLSTLDYVVPAYYTIAAAEASANLARFNGVRYGYRPAFCGEPG